MKIVRKVDYLKQRQKAYPPMTELADALVHQALGNPQPLKDYVAKCKAVKERHPKPQR